MSNFQWKKLCWTTELYHLTMACIQWVGLCDILAAGISRNNGQAINTETSNVTSCRHLQPKYTSCVHVHMVEFYQGTECRMRGGKLACYILAGCDVQRCCIHCRHWASSSLAVCHCSVQASISQYTSQQLNADNKHWPLLQTSSPWFLLSGFLMLHKQ